MDGSSHTTDEGTPPTYDLLSEAYDLAPSSDPVVRSYVICSTPRSGSTLLAEALHHTGVLGVPAEYIGLSGTVPQLYARWECGGLNDYVDRLHAVRSTENRIFGIKVHWHQLLEFSNVSQGKPREAPVDFSVLSAVVMRVAPNPAFVFVSRRDRARQAVSHWIASQTLQWHDVGAEPAPDVPPYDFAGIQRMTEGIDESEESWERFFTLGQLSPLRLIYEDFVGDYDATVRRVADFVGVDSTTLTIPPPRLRKQSRPASVEYAARYRADLARGSAG